MSELFIALPMHSIRFRLGLYTSLLHPNVSWEQSKSFNALTYKCSPIFLVEDESEEEKLALFLHYSSLLKWSTPGIDEAKFKKETLGYTLGPKVLLYKVKPRAHASNKFQYDAIETFMSSLYTSPNSSSFLK